MTKAYLPSNGTEGMQFEAEFCDKCLKMSIDPCAKRQCNYWGKAMLGEYNGKWVYKNAKPTCTAFKDRKEYNKNRKRYIKKDTNQRELF